MRFNYTKQTLAVYSGNIVVIPDEVIADLRAWDNRAFPTIGFDGKKRRAVLDIANSTFDTIALSAENRHPSSKNVERCPCCGAVKKTIAPIVG